MTPRSLSLSALFPTARLVAAVHMLRALRQALAIRRDRQHLARLDDHLLADIGLDRAKAMSESQRPLWDVPRNWRE